MSGPLILGLETSCDETSAAVIEAPLIARGHDLAGLRRHRALATALAAGAGGATVSKARHGRMDGETTAVSAAREMAELVIGKDIVEDVSSSLVAAGVFGEEAAGFVAFKPVTVAYTPVRGEN